MTVLSELDAAGRCPLAGDGARVSLQASATYQADRYLADPPPVDEMMAVMRNGPR